MKHISTVKTEFQARRTALTRACAGSCQRALDQVARVRETLHAEWKSVVAVPERLLRLALNEAEALAWQTDVPQLVFPALAEEKVRAVVAWSVRQRSLISGRPAAMAA